MKVSGRRRSVMRIFPWVRGGPGSVPAFPPWVVRVRGWWIAGFFGGGETVGQVASRWSGSFARLRGAFVRRFVLHVLPAGHRRLRHHGLLVGAGRKAGIARIRALLGQPPAIAPPRGGSRSPPHPAPALPLLRWPHARNRGYPAWPEPPVARPTEGPRSPMTRPSPGPSPSRPPHTGSGPSVRVLPANRGAPRRQDGRPRCPSPGCPCPVSARPGARTEHDPRWRRPRSRPSASFPDA